MVKKKLPAPAAIWINGQGQGRPFSKGVLAQSLLAAAIDPQDAFDVAREIERELRRRRVSEIDRNDLRGLAFKTLSNTIGSRAAERYARLPDHRHRSIGARLERVILARAFYGEL